VTVSLHREPLALAVFASGAGSNFAAICRAIDEGELQARIAVCISDRPSAGVLTLARERGISTEVISHRGEDDEVGRSILEALDRYAANFVALAGYLRKIPEVVVDAFENRMVNIHPSLLPAFGGKGMYGRRVHEAVLASGDRVSGATVHLVDNTYDTGPVVLQQSVDVSPDDTADALAARVLQVEHTLYPAALQLFASGRVVIDGRRITIRDDNTA